MNKKLSPLLLLLFMAAVTHTLGQDLALRHVKKLDYLRPSSTQNPLYFIVHNNGSSMIAFADVTCYWQWDGGVVHQAVPQSVTTWIPANDSRILKGSDFITDAPVGQGAHALKAWITVSSGDVNATNDTLNLETRVISGLPQKNVIIYTFKHQLCGPCYYAAEYLQNQVGQADNHTLINIYTGSTDICTSYDSHVLQDDFGSSTHPVASIDIYDFDKGSYLQSFYTQSGSYKLENFGEREYYLQPVEVSIQNLQADSATRKISFDVMARFMDTMTGEFRFNAYLLEDSVFGFQMSAPDPNRYWHKNVLRDAAAGSRGVYGAVPGVVYPGDSFVQHFEILVYSKVRFEQTKIVGLLQRHPSALQNGEVLNSTRTTLKEYYDKLDISSAYKPSVRCYPNPTKGKISVELPETLGSADYTILDMLGREISSGKIRGPKEVLDLSTTPAGVYTLSISSEGKRVVQQIFKN